ncbi:MAG: trigger factor [Phycisphaerae bacterium]|nr:trigger factor [Phycisphaerae bacterium]
MAASPAGGVEHKVTIEDAGPSRKRLRFTVPGKVVAEQIEQSLGALAMSASLPGFRPGHAPRRLIEKRFGSGVREEAKNQIIASAYSSAIKEHKISVIGDPEGNEELAKLALEPGKDMHFHVEVDVMPEFDIPSTDGLEVFKPTFTPSEKDVDDQINMLAVNEGSLEPRDRAEPGDYCIGHGVMKDQEGKSLIDIEGAVIQIPPTDRKGKGAILGVLVDDFGKQAGLPAANETITVKAKGPENHENEQVRGKDLTITFEVAQVQRIIPCPMDELLRKTGLPTEESLREAMMNRLKQRAVVEQQGAMRQQIARYLVEKVEVPLPQRLTARQSEANLARARMDLLHRGMDDLQIEERMAQLRAASAASAVRDLKLTFILARVAQTLQVQVNQDEVLGRIAQMAVERRVRPDQMRQELEKRNQIGFVVQQVRDHKTMDALLARAKVSDISVEEFNKKFAAARA